MAQSTLHPPRAATLAILCGLATIAATPALAARAQDDGDGVGVSAWAAPALSRVLVAQETEPGVDAATLAGWGYTEDVLGAGDSHHRALGSAAVAARPLRWLTIAAQARGRWDHHLVTGNDDESAVGEPRLMLRGDVIVAPGLALGLASILLVPGTDAPSLAFEASTLDLRALASYTPTGTALVLALDLGWRFDGTARAVTRPIPFGRADLVSLGASDSDALLVGAGAAVRIDDSELFAEVTADVLIEGSTAASPVRVAAGARLPLVPRLLSFLVSAEAGLGGRAAVDPLGGLVPVEPRLAVAIGLVLSPRISPTPPASAETADAVDADHDDVGAEAVPEPALPTSITVSGHVLDPSGSPLAAATVRVETEGGPSTTTGADGSFTLEGVPREGELLIEAEGYVASHVAPGETMLSATLERALPSGALRGLVRSHHGRALSARIAVEPGGHTATTDADGVFELLLVPGHYDVAIEADGHDPQRRTVEIEVGGVTVINADLRRSR